MLWFFAIVFYHLLPEPKNNMCLLLSICPLKRSWGKTLYLAGDQNEGIQVLQLCLWNPLHLAPSPGCFNCWAKEMGKLMNMGVPPPPRVNIYKGSLQKMNSQTMYYVIAVSGWGIHPMWTMDSNLPSES